jgi:hypothetical protein
MAPPTNPLNYPETNKNISSSENLHEQSNYPEFTNLVKGKTVLPQTGKGKKLE